MQKRKDNPIPDHPPKDSPHGPQGAGAELHPDPLIDREVRIDELEGLLAEAHAGLLRALDYRAATPNGLAIKRDVRDALRRTGFIGNFGNQAEAQAPKPITQTPPGGTDE